MHTNIFLYLTHFKKNQCMASNLLQLMLIESEVKLKTTCLSGRLFIADTNNSLIRYLDLNEESLKLRTLDLKGFQQPSPKSKVLKRLRRRSSADTVTIATDAVSSNEGRLSIQISLPKEYHFSKVFTIILSLNYCSM